METDLGTDFLFAMPSPIYGIGRLLDLGAQLDSYNESLTAAIADFLALSSDWRIVGQDLESAFRATLDELLAVKDQRHLQEHTHRTSNR